MSEIKVIPDLLLDAANDPERRARKFIQVNTNQSFNRGDLLLHAKNIATWLDNVGASEKVGFVSGSLYGLYAAFFGCEMSGRAAVMVNPNLPVENIVNLLQFTEVNTIFTDMDDDQIKVLQDKFPESNLKIVCLKSSIEYLDIHNIIADTDCREPDKTIDENSLAVIIFTSGTTGKQKAVMLSHKNLVTDVLSHNRATDYSVRDKVVCIIPPFHAFGLTCELLVATQLGIELVFEESVQKVLVNLPKHEPTVLVLVPMLADMLARFLKAAECKMPGADKAMIKKVVLGSKIRVIAIGGAAPKIDSMNKLFEYNVQTRLGYGMSELSPIASTNDSGAQFPTAAGIPIDIMKVRIKDGEVQVQGSNVCMGYYKDEEEFRKMWDGDWLRTGDLGYIDEPSGMLILTGRLKNLIITSSGENVSPELLEHSIHEYGLTKEEIAYAHDDRIYAQVFPEEGVTKEQIDKAINALNETLPTFSQISKVIVRTEEFKKNVTGKIIRNQVN